MGDDVPRPAAPGVAPGAPSAGGLLRRLTERSVLDALLAAGTPVSRADLARRTGISPPTVSEAVRRLSADGLLAEAGRREGVPGAVATLYRLGPGAGLVVGATVGVAGTVAVATDLAGTEVARYEIPGHVGGAEAAARLARAVRRVVADATPAPGAPPVPRAVAVSVAAPVDPCTGAVVDLDVFHFEGGLPSLRDALITGAGPGPGPAVPAGTAVLVDNDVNLAALAEREDGAARGCSTFAYLFAGAGMGSAVMSDGRLVRGARGLAGELSFLPHDGPGTEAGADPAAPPDPSRRTAFAAALRLEQEPVGVLLGRAARTLCVVIDPEILVVGGPRGLDREVVSTVRRAVADLAPRPVPVVMGEHGSAAPLRGALLAARSRAREDLGASPLVR